MLLNALSSNKITLTDATYKLNKRLRQLGNNVLSNSRFGTKNKVDELQFYNIKYLSPLLASYDETDYKQYLAIRNKQELLTQIYKLVGI
jgi:hypothetical protein